jgi:hypothetical protein
MVEAAAAVTMARAKGRVTTETTTTIDPGRCRSNRA